MCEIYDLHERNESSLSNRSCSSETSDVGTRLASSDGLGTGHVRGKDATKSPKAVVPAEEDDAEGAIRAASLLAGAVSHVTAGTV